MPHRPFERLLTATTAGRLIVVGLCLVVAGCATMPALDGARASRSDVPPATLLPLDQILAQAETGMTQDQALSGLEARAAALRARAARLRLM